jgi:molecular chaperone HscC
LHIIWVNSGAIKHFDGLSVEMIVGIDLGTTHSLIGRFTVNGPELFPNALGDFLTPSVISVDAQGTTLIGAAARECLNTDPNNTAAAFKRNMGTVKEYRLGNKRLRPEELSALILKSLITDAETSSGEKVTEAVISVPAYFSDAQRKATRAAGELAGVRVERLINEPTAAALAYGLSERKDGSSFLVFDLGGGTFDVSILEMFEGVMEVHATAGDNYLGGEDFLEVLEKACLADLKLTANGLSDQERGLLRLRLERAKVQLSSAPEARVEVEIKEQRLPWMITESRFSELCQPLLTRLRTPIERAMRDAKLTPDSLEEIVLVGGASRMPMVPRLIARMFGRLPLRHINPDQVIALGAAVIAGMKARHENFKEIVLTDVCPYTLGLEVSERDEKGGVITGMFSPIIERNTTVPTSKVQTYSPIEDFQSFLNLRIFQGESPRVVNNIALGKLEIPLAKKKASENPVDVRFTYDVNGILQVEALVQSTQEKHELVIQQNPGVMTEAEIRASLAQLAELKIHPRDDQANAALVARADRLYGEFLRERELIKHNLTHFMAILEGQDRHQIAKARVDFGGFLDALEKDLG